MLRRLKVRPSQLKKKMPHNKMPRREETRSKLRVRSKLRARLLRNKSKNRNRNLRRKRRLRKMQARERKEENETLDSSTRRHHSLSPA